jgi:2-polyprenyl-6-methoxyphenol hydroxylase-like FAD-dependent oxidoreductase
MISSSYDVAVVGYGPVGQAIAALLGRAGHRVAVFETFAEIYPLPRAVHFDHEIMRLCQELGVAEQISDDLTPLNEYHWFGADGDPIFTINTPTPSISGWEPDYMFFQPRLEAALDRAARAFETVEVHRGYSAEELVAVEGGVELTVRRVSEPVPGSVVATDEVQTVHARYVVGADGANSFVRNAIGVDRRDLGFQERWLVMDVKPNDMQALSHLPIACQWCDPRRPTTHVHNGRRHRRWEFMLLAGEQAGDFDDESRQWELLAPFMSPEDGEIVRHAVYEFRSLLANRMREGNVLLIGDAAHLTPPFMGQGLCTGLRDAANVAWKLDLVLRGLASDSLLETIDSERQPQNEWVIGLAVEMGRVSCVLDADAAAERDAGLRAAGSPPPLQFAGLGPGALRDSGAEPAPLAGTLSVQGRVAGPGGEGLFDDVVGRGFTLICAHADPRAELSPEQLATLELLEVTVVSLDPDAACAISDLDGRLTAWLDENAVCAVLVRPDFYVFGAAQSAEDLGALIDEVRAKLALRHPSTTP